MIGSIAPPKEHLELGDRVRYHHRACVARIPKQEKYGNMGTGMFANYKPEPFPPRWEPIRSEGGLPPFDFDSNFVEHMLAEPTKRNKTIIIWPAEGSGVVVAMFRRGIGSSYSGYTSGYEYPEYEPGGFDVQEWHWLYGVRSHLQQKEMYYVPLWAAIPLNFFEEVDGQENQRSTQSMVRRISSEREGTTSEEETSSS